MSAKSLIPVLLVTLLISVFSLASIQSLGLAQDSTAFRISGFILDSNGRGIGGAMIIFGVPLIVPSVYSDSSGDYVISAPAGTYHVNVWPPFDSNFIYYDQQGFVVGSDTIKNITLASGHKVSGYILDSSGKPVPKAVVALNNFLCGWYSNYSGYYFVTAPAGTYTLSARPANGPKDAPSFPTYYEYNFTVSGNIVKNITVSGSSLWDAPASTTPLSPSPSPWRPPVTTDAEQTLHIQLYSDDFSGDSEVWQYLESAYRDTTNQYLVLTGPTYEQAGVVFFDAPILGPFTASFRYRAGGGNYQGDGFTMFFYKQEYSTVDRGGSLGFSSSSIVPGYGIEFDGWQNIPMDFQKIAGGQSDPPGDPSSSHVALIQDYAGNHLAYANNQRAADNNWHEVTVDVQEASVMVFVDQELVLQWNGTLDTTYGGFGFSAGNGQVGSNWHIVDDLSIMENIAVEAAYEESDDQTGATEGANAEVIQIAENSVLSVSSNSTVSSLAFNSTTSELSFTVSGLPGTTGYVKVGVAKSLVSNAENIKVYLDGNGLDYEVESNADVWLLSFTYTHSIHQVSINFAGSVGGIASPGIESWVLVLALTIAALVGANLRFSKNPGYRRSA